MKDVDDEQTLNVELAYLNNDLRALHAMAVTSVRDMLHPEAPAEFADDVYPNLVALACGLLPTGRYERKEIEAVIATLDEAKNEYRNAAGCWEGGAKKAMRGVLLDLQEMIQKENLFQRMSKTVEMI